MGDQFLVDRAARPQLEEAQPAPVAFERAELDRQRLPVEELQVHVVAMRRNADRIAAMALDYLAWTGRLEDPCRFYVVAIDGFGTAKMTIRVIEDAFQIDR